MADVALSVENLHKRYGTVHALRGVSFSVPRGAFMGLLGRNGAGKTTCLDIIAGLLVCDAGTVTLLGERLRIEYSVETKRRFAYVAGHIQPFIWLTCRETLSLMAQLYPTWDADREAQLLRRFRLPLDRAVAALSPGQAFQLQVVAALARHPDVLVVDEPGRLDVLVRRRLMSSVLEAIAEQQITVVMATHIISELQNACDHLCIIHYGQVVAVGTVDDVIGRARLVRYSRPDPAAADRWVSQPPDGAHGAVRRGDDIELVLWPFDEARAEAIAADLKARDFEASPLTIEDFFVAVVGDDSE